MAQTAKNKTDLPDEDLGAGVEPTPVDERVVAGQKVQVIEATPSNEQVAPSPGSDRTPGEPTPSPGGSSDAVTISVRPEEAEAMKVLLSQLSMVGGAAGLAAFIEQSREALAREKTVTDINEVALKSHQDRLKEMGITLQSAATPEIAAREMRARDKLEAKTLGLDRARVPGGVYLQPDGKTYVNANGDVVNADGSKVS